MKYVTTKKFEESIRKCHRNGGEAQNSAKKVTDMLGRINILENPLESACAEQQENTPKMHIHVLAKIDISDILKFFP